MATKSSSSRSPDTASWRAVGSLYAQAPPAEPRVVLAAIRKASKPLYPGILIDEGTALLAERLQDQVKRGPLVGSEGAVLMSETARRALAAAHANSWAAEIALRAMTRLVIRGITPDSDPRPAFAAELVFTAFDYLLWRDLTRYLGTPALPNSSAQQAYASAIMSEARRQALDAVGRAPSGLSWPGLVRTAWG